MVDDTWFDDVEVDDFGQIDEYDITAAPNDFNLLTLQSFVESGAIKIPGFQRNYVWDKMRASKLIESFILGIPVPQLFLYEESKNKFLVIDGQQRLMTIYYFFKQRFPRKERRAEIREIFDEHKKIPDEILHDDKFFEKFSLSLPGGLPGAINKFSGINYSTLGDYKTQFDLRPLRNIVVRQNSPQDDDSSIYEVFNRLNTGGVNLRPQEIRTSMYHSDFYDTLYLLNSLQRWREVIRRPQPDLHSKDIEILLRSFAMLISGSEYKPSLVKFLNNFSKRSRENDREKNVYLSNLFKSFLDSCSGLDEKAFINPRNDRFNVVLFEAVFSAACGQAFTGRRLLNGNLEPSEIRDLSENVEFISASLEGTTRTDNVSLRLRLAREKITAL